MRRRRLLLGGSPAEPPPSFFVHVFASDSHRLVQPDLAAGRPQVDTEHYGVTYAAADPARHTTAPTCGGVLLDELHVATAAHCVSTPPSRVGVGGDANESNACTEQIDVIDTHLHPNWNPKAILDGYDVAVLTLVRAPICWGTANVRALPLGGGCWHDCRGGTGVVYGSGVDETGRASDGVRAANVTLLSDAACAPLLRGLSRIPPSIGCAGTAAHGVICNGDSGGPLVAHDTTGRSVLVGITSLIVGSCDEPLLARSGLKLRK